MPEPKKKSRLCPECGTDTPLDENSTQGCYCPNCGLDVAWCVEKRRRERALQKMREEEEQEQEKAKPAKKIWQDW